MIKLSEKITAYNVDCMEFMANIPDKLYDLAIVDPPYGIGESGESNRTRSKLAIAKDYKAFSGQDLKPASKEYFIELLRISKNQIIFGANHFIENIPNANSSSWVIWDKLNGDSDFADCELAWTSFNSAARIFKFRWSGMLQGDMKNKQIRIHPTEKPIALYKWLINKYAKPTDKILDTHGGSFSHAIAAFEMDMYLDICELDKDYFDVAIERFNKQTLQHKLQQRLEL